MVLVFLPLGSVGGVASHGLSNLGFPTGEDIVRAGGGTVERRGGRAGQKVAIHLIGKDFFTVHAVGISNDVLFFLVVRDTVVVLVVFPLSDIGDGFSHGSRNCGIPAGEDVVFPHRLVGRTDPCRRSNVGQQILILLLGEGSSVSRAVSVSHGVLRRHAQDIVLGGSIHHSPLAIHPLQIDDLLASLAVVGSVSTLCNAQLGVKRIHILVEGIDLHFAVVSAMYNAERAVDQTEGLAAVAGFVVGADDLYRLVAQQLLDFFLAGLRGRSHRIAFNVNLSGRNQPFRRRPPLQILVPIQIIDNTGNFTFRIRADMTGMILTIKISKILIQINFNCATPLTTFTLLFITYTVIAVLQTIAVIVVNGSLTNELNNHLIRAKDKVLAQFGIIGLNRGILFPHSIQSSRPSIAILDNIIAKLRYGTCGGSFCAVTVVNRVRPIICLPALENIAFAGGNGVLNIKSVRSDSRICCRPRISAGCTRTSVSVIRQRVCIFSDGIGVLRYEINRSALVAGGGTAHVKLPHFGICIGFFRPTDDLVTAVDTCTISCCLDVTDGDCVIVICRVAVRRRILANKLRLFRRTIIVANIEFVTHIQDSECNIDLVSCIQLRQCVERQQTENHDE